MEKPLEVGKLCTQWRKEMIGLTRMWLALVQVAEITKE
jgi:hypothetical protein